MKEKEVVIVLPKDAFRYEEANELRITNYEFRIEMTSVSLLNNP